MAFFVKPAKVIPRRHAAANAIEAGPAAVYFAAVVVITMFAAENFDPRLIWDVIEEEV